MEGEHLVSGELGVKLRFTSRVSFLFFLFLVALAVASFLLFSLNSFANPDQKILFIGDSHSSQAVGNAIRDTLITNEVVKKENWFQYSIGSTCMHHWLSGSFGKLDDGYAYTDKNSNLRRPPGSAKGTIPSFKKLMDRHHPQKVVILLGANDLSHYLDSLSLPTHPSRQKLLQTYLNRAEKLIDLIGADAQCNWILLPHSKESSTETSREFDDALSKTIDAKNCHVIDARETRLSQPGQTTTFKPEPNREAERPIHFLPELGYALGQSIAAQLQEVL